jgi:hypothetical protein
VKDLLVLAADADAMAFLRSLLLRPEAMGVRPLDFSLDRHPQRDAGVVQSGAELLRMRKGAFAKVLLVLDHHGCGREHRQSAPEVAANLQSKLDTFTWSSNSAVAVLSPELEHWLWHCEAAVAKHCQVSMRQLGAWTSEYAQRLSLPLAQVKQHRPKELFEYVMGERLRRTVSPRDFEQIGSHASVAKLMASDSFAFVRARLQAWFPMHGLGER